MIMGNNKTLDVLDSYITEEHSDWLSPKFKIRKRNYTESLLLDPINWEKYYKEIESHGLVWNEFKYNQIKNLNDIDSIINDNKTGFYMFVIKPNNLIYDLPKNVLYIGMSGENNSERPLKDRIKDYYNLEKIKKRNAVIRMIEKYYHNIYVAFSLIDKPTYVLKEIESSLIGFFYPIVNKDDFPGELKPDKKAF
jgi:hypothetical protein